MGSVFSIINIILELSFLKPWITFIKSLFHETINFFKYYFSFSYCINYQSYMCLSLSAVAGWMVVVRFSGAQVYAIYDGG
jgi:hypothetical protein